MNIKAVIFDLDGVILSTDEYHYLAWKAIADSLNIPFDKEKNNKLRGVSRMASLDIILDGYGKYTLKQKEELAEKKNNIYRQLLGNMTPDIVDKKVIFTLDTLKKNNIKIGIGSSSKNTKFILEKVNLLNKFDVIVDGNDIKNSKPDPEVFTLCAKRLNEKPCDCLVVEDAISGIEAACRGGFVPVAISDAKKHQKAQYKIDTLDEIIKLIA